MVIRKSYKHLFYTFFALAIMMMSWEGTRSNAALAEGAIPDQSIRLRILANSDKPEDQAIKRLVRDAIVAQMNEWVTGPHSIDEARQIVQQNLPVLEEVVRNTLTSRGLGGLPYTVELGQVPFPTKMYGNRVYPAGDYEALRVSLGEGKGQNWWCVLFPPLCFVDGVSGEAVAQAAPAEDGGKGTDEAKTAGVQKKTADAPAEGSAAAATAGGDTEVKFFLWELLQGIIGFFLNLFR
ncbi:stage II sporulation protein R [Paenibacillus chitinolyticus]|uniref:Stage II sporulation protein R n=1 Tax=Paenibacillus chitinolyticus TaxID=79263 RepID=A0A410WQF9_9BACL|nr:stage II sporulation protein R [Paenibacillus chitinolyticus]MCY9591757.1 stage II sporulation protein R [Paenibacillus chitinolyticus]MCY9596116.1 stage II sporulation protein R [Paenibacillus chitinolyticus]QAV16595.1 stage II sporulation protein R [Paenibacillus chitinolyticus]